MKLSMRWPAEASPTFSRRTSNVLPKSFILPYTSELIDPVRADILAAQTRFRWTVTSPQESSRTINGLPQQKVAMVPNRHPLITLVLFARTTHTQELFVRPFRRDALKTDSHPRKAIKTPG